MKDPTTQAPFHILIADNDADLRRATIEALRERHQSAVIQEVADCTEALKAVLSGQVDCMFLDLKLIVDNGGNCLTRMLEAKSPTPVVVLTPDGDENLGEAAVRAEAADYLPKADLTPQLLDHCLRAAIRYQHAQEQLRFGGGQMVLRRRSHPLAKCAFSIGVRCCQYRQGPAIGP